MSTSDETGGSPRSTRKLVNFLLDLAEQPQLLLELERTLGELKPDDRAGRLDQLRAILERNGLTSDDEVIDFLIAKQTLRELRMELEADFESSPQHKLRITYVLITF